MRVSCHVTYRIASHRIAGHRMSVRDICTSKYEDVCKLIGVPLGKEGRLAAFVCTASYLDFDDDDDGSYSSCSVSFPWVDAIRWTVEEGGEGEARQRILGQ